MKVIVSQYGARRRYLIPQILHQRHLLAALYTDSYADSVLGRVAKVLSAVGLKRLPLSRLINRKPNIPEYKIVSNDWLQVSILLKKIFRRPNREIMDLIFEGSSQYFISKGIPQADWLYNMFIENIDFAKYAKSQGLKIIADIYENPYIFRSLIKELDEPELECIRYTIENQRVQADLREKHLDDLLQIADKLLVPSLYVKDSLKQSPFYDESKINVIPYISSVKNVAYANEPVRGRIIWVGNDPVRKGLLYANRAIRKLQKIYPDIEFRVIGPIQKELCDSEYFSNIKFLGYLSKDELKQEFNAADMFVFPTLAEGFAGVLLEAASFGVPIITTRASGFDDKFPGIIVPFKDSQSIEDAIIRLYEDREYRNDMSHFIFNYSQNQSVDNFAEKLVSVFD